MRVFLVEPFRFPDQRRVVVAANPDEACRICGIAPGEARVKDQTRFALHRDSSLDTRDSGLVARARNPQPPTPNPQSPSPTGGAA